MLKLMMQMAREGNKRRSLYQRLARFLRCRAPAGR
jgi:hypothetical protein